MKRILAILGAVLAITFLTAKIFADQNDRMPAQTTSDSASQAAPNNEVEQR